MMWLRGSSQFMAEVGEKDGFAQAGSFGPAFIESQLLVGFFQVCGAHRHLFFQGFFMQINFFTALLCFFQHSIDQLDKWIVKIVPEFIDPLRIVSLRNDIFKGFPNSLCTQRPYPVSHFSASQRSASRDAAQPVPAAVTACLYL